MKITKKIARKVVETVNCGLSKGLGNPKEGQMCVEAAVCYAMGLPHSDNPPCVAPSIRAVKIGLNDANWSSNEARAKGMLRLAVLQLGTKDNFDEAEFIKRLVRVTITKTVPKALRYAASIHPKLQHKEALEKAAKECETRGTQDAAAYAAADAAARAADAAARAAYTAADAAARAAYAAAYAAADAAAYAAYAAARAAYTAADAAARAAYATAEIDKELLLFAKEVEDILIDMKVEGVKWLTLTE